MGRFLEVGDLPDGTGDAIGLPPESMVEDAEGLALLAAPCLGDDAHELTEAQMRGVKAILRGAIMRWSDAGSGARQTESAGTLSATIDTTVVRRGMFWPSEIASLQGICSDGESGKAFTVDTLATADSHAATCSLNLGATYCSCGADIAGFPLFGGD